MKHLESLTPAVNPAPTGTVAGATTAAPTGTVAGATAPAALDDLCPVARTAEIISGKWTLLIIRDLATGTKRFSQLERSLHGISPKTLSERLNSLEHEGIITRQTFAEVPPKVEYSLTAKGQDLVALVEAMRAYGNRWLLCEEAH